jgi:hypothetical protein
VIAYRGGLAVGKVEYQRPAVATQPVRLLPRPVLLAGREGLLAELHARLSAGSGAGPRVVALCGLGGCGKTSVAVEYAHRQLAGLGMVWQFSAEDPTALAVGFGDLAAQLGVRNMLDAGDPVAQVHAVLAAYPRDWLLVFDDVPSASAVAQVLPPTGRGRVLVTSQDPRWPGDQRLEVPTLDGGAAAAFLLARTGDSDLAAARELASEVGGLPLALEQAAAYMLATGRPIAGYLDLFRHRRGDLLARGEPTGYAKQTATTWRLAFDQLQQTAPLAIGLLRLLACCAAENIPVPLLLQPRCGLPSDLPAELVLLLEDPLTADDALAALRRFSLVSAPRGGLVSVHRLVQAVTLGQLSAALAVGWRKAAASLIDAALPGDPERPENWPDYGALLPHALAALADGSSSMEAVAGYLAASGGHLAACRLERKVVDARERNLGADHPDTLRARVKLAEWTGGTGDAAGARDELEGLLPLLERALGGEHRHTLAARAALALWTGDAGDPTGARDQLTMLLPVLEKALGPGDETLLSARGKLAYWIGASGDAASARDLLTALSPLVEQHFGAEHPQTLLTRANLAWWTGKAGDAAGALALGMTLVPVAEQVLGTEHPETLAIRADCAYWAGKTGDTAGARAQYASLVPTAERVLGAGHPEVLSLRANLATWTGETGDPADARDQYAALMPTARQVFGSGHFKTLSMRAGLASWTGQAGDAAQARDQFVELLPLLEQTLGPDHHDTHAVRVQLSLWAERAQARNCDSVHDAKLKLRLRVTDAGVIDRGPAFRCRLRHRHR